MSKYKEGDKFIGEILEIHEDDYGKVMYGLGSGRTRMGKKEYELDALQQYHEPTLEEHAIALKENCDKYFNVKECNGCEFAKGLGCKINKEPLDWDLEQKPKLTEKERETLEFWKKQGAEYVDGFFDGIISHSDENKASIGTLHSEYAPNIYEIVGTSYKKIEDLLKGEDG